MLLLVMMTVCVCVCVCAWMRRRAVIVQHCAVLTRVLWAVA
jgi:hypothetical protein